MTGLEAIEVIRGTAEHDYRLYHRCRTWDDILMSYNNDCNDFPEARVLLGNDAARRVYFTAFQTIIGRRFPTATAILEVWERPWSYRAIRFASFALHRAMVHGCNVLEA